MTSNYYKKGREFTENLANELFVSAGLNSRLNNTINTSAVDILVDGIKIDVQYSNNYLNGPMSINWTVIRKLID